MWERERQKKSVLYCTSWRHTTINTFDFNRRIYQFSFLCIPMTVRIIFTCVCQCFMFCFVFCASNVMVSIFNFLKSFLTIQFYTQFLPLLLWGWVGCFCFFLQITMDIFSLLSFIFNSDLSSFFSSIAYFTCSKPRAPVF